MNCVALGDPYPVLNEKRKLECFIDVEVLHLLRGEKGGSEKNKRLQLQIANSSPNVALSVVRGKFRIFDYSPLSSRNKS